MPQACLLAIIAGYADAVGFLKYDTFAGLMTGNTIFLGIAVSNGKFGAAFFQFFIIAVFTAGVILARVFLRVLGRPWIPMSLVSVLLIVCGFLRRDIAAPVLALAMGVQKFGSQSFQRHCAEHGLYHRQSAEAWRGPPALGMASKRARRES